MAIYHLSIKIVSRGKGKSAVAAAAYRAGEMIKNEYDGITHDYSKKGGVIHTEILLPADAPAEYLDRSVLWNAVENIENAKNAQLAREIELALPAELSVDQNISLAREYAKQHFVERGMCADICIHDKNDGNPHAHILLTMRPIEPDGAWGAKSKKEYILNSDGEKIKLKSGEFKTRKICAVDWNEQSKAEEWRSGWADSVNAVLERQKISVRVDHRSYKRQGVEQIPTVHMGVAATQMERKGIVTRRGEQNRIIGITNQESRQLRARIRKLENWLKEETESAELPILADAVTNTLSRKAATGKSEISQSIANLKDSSKTLMFLQENQIKEMADLERKVRSLRKKESDNRENLKPVERRLKILSEHIRQAEIHRKHKDIYRQYQQEKNQKKREEFAETHRAEIILYESADRYLKDVMNGKTGLPIKAWKAEYAELTSKKEKLYQEYYKLKNEVREVEVIKRNVADILGERKTDNRSPQLKKHYER